MGGQEETDIGTNIVVAMGAVLWPTV